MSSVVLSGDTSGTLTLSAPAVAGSSTQTLAAVTGTLAPIVSGTAVSASGTSVDFTGIPAWAKKITIIFNGVSSSSTSHWLVQIGSGSFNTSGYGSYGVRTATTGIIGTTSSAGYIMYNDGATAAQGGHMFLTNISGNIWVSSHGTGSTNTSVNSGQFGGGNSPSLSGTLDRVRITTVNGTDTFDAGTINIIYE